MHSFTDLVPYLFNLPGVKYFLSERLCQDALEKFFGKQRQRGRSNENPNVAATLKNNQALRVISSINLDAVKGNTRGTNSLSMQLEDVQQPPLPKRKRRSVKNKGNNALMSISSPTLPYTGVYGLWVGLGRNW